MEGTPMKRIIIPLFVLSLFHDNVTTAFGNTTAESVSDNVEITLSLWNHSENDAFKQRINLAPFNRLNINVIDVPSDIWFIVLQIHTFQYNATLSYDKALLDKVSDRSLFGSNIGLYLKTYNVTTPIQVFLKHDNVHHLDALLVIIPYGRNAPIPGGCNMEFDIEVSPYQKLQEKNGMIIVDAQPASVLAPNGLPILCEKSVVQHKIYRLYLPTQDFTQDTYFDAMASMLTTQDVARNGDEIPSNTFTSSMRHIYSAYIGTGSIYAIVSTYGNYSSAYVPIFTYACSPLLYPENCQNLDVFTKVICPLILMISCLSIITGYKYVYISRPLLSCMTGAILGHTAIMNIGYDYNLLIDSLIILIVFILVFILIFLSKMFIRYYQLDTYQLDMFSRNILLGFLCACIMYLYAPVWMFYILENNWAFWPMFISLIILTTFLLTMFHASEIITYAIFESYCTIVAIDYYIGSNLKYIIITTVERIIVPEFHLAFVYPPFQSADITLIIIWSVLIVVRCIQHTVINFIRYRKIHIEDGNTERVPLSTSHYDGYSTEKYT